ncbi:MAG: SIS domain-containing protein [Pseudomonadota bacterium]|nr:SIS domain-containing protein [Pseudomonadota bacterium]
MKYRLNSRLKRMLSHTVSHVTQLAYALNESSWLAVEKSLLDCKGAIVVTGVGKAGIVAKKFVATLRSYGTKAIFLHPVDAGHGDMGVVDQQDLLLFISNSGNTLELIELAKASKALGCMMIAITGSANSSLGKLVDQNLVIGKPPEVCVVQMAPTTSVIWMLMICDLLASGVAQHKQLTPDVFKSAHPHGSLGARSVELI